MEYGICFDRDSTKVLCDGLDLIYFKPLASADIYYGINSSPIVTENIIKSTFFIETGFVGSPSGRLYVFPSGYSYKYWCIPDLPNTGDRVINEISNGIVNTVLAYDTYYSYYQLNPTPGQSITYGKLNINNITYRVYRTITKASTSLEQYVFSF